MLSPAKKRQNLFQHAPLLRGRNYHYFSRLFLEQPGNRVPNDCIPPSPPSAERARKPVRMPSVGATTFLPRPFLLSLFYRVRGSQAWRPGRIGTESSPKSSQPAPETVQMVPAAAAKPSSGNGSARSGSSSARASEGRLPSMQLVRVNSASDRPAGSKADGTGHNISSGDKNGDGESGVDGGGGGGASWLVAVAAPMPVLHGFCLAVIGLTTGMVGANVAVVDRSAVAADEEAAVGFLGFDQVRTIASVSHPEGDKRLIRTPSQVTGLIFYSSVPRFRHIRLGVYAIMNYYKKKKDML